MILAYALSTSQAAAGGDATGEDEFDHVYRGRPGLVATWSDEQRSVSRLESRLELRLARHQSPHPAIDGDSFRGHWRGALNILQPGRYRFVAHVLGSFRLRIDDREVLTAQSGGAGEVVSVSSQPLELDYGRHALEARYQSPRERRAELHVLWESDDDFREPIPAAVLVHDEPQETALWKRWQQIEMGRELVARLGCVNCHVAGSERTASLMISPDEGPRLDGIGGRRYQAWLYHWLKRPSEFRAHASMPRLFGETQSDAVDLFAAASFLAHQDGPLARGDGDQSLPQAPRETSAASLPADATVPTGANDAVVDTLSPGEERFARMGCIACHRALSETNEDPGELRSVNAMASKTNRRGIADWLKAPRQFHPGTRMPDFELGTSQADHLDVLVDYLAASRRDSFERLPPPPSRDEIISRLSMVDSSAESEPHLSELETAQLVSRLGQAVVESRGCLACHRIDALKNRAAAASDFDALVRQMYSSDAAGGCLAVSPPRGLPKYEIGDLQRTAVRAFLTEAVEHSLTIAPTFAGEMTLERAGCLACHRRNGHGGRFSERITQFVRLEQGMQLSDLSAPDLSGVGEKLNAAWIRKVIVDGRRARPWMELRMPLFARHLVQELPEQLVQSDGQDLEPENRASASLRAADVEAGRLLAGRTAMNCAGCHDVLGRPGLGVRGPDLAGISERIRPDWFRRWMVNPQRIARGTRMPSYFYGGRSSVPQHLNGDVDRQIEALWSYFSLGPRMPLPSLDMAPGRIVAGGETNRPTPSDRPIAVHGFMVGHAGLRGVALGYPAGTHFAFDAGACRLTRVWTGPFIKQGGWFDAGRGSAEEDGIHVLGEIVWRGPEQALVAFSSAANPEALPAIPSAPHHTRFDAHWTTASDGGFSFQIAAGPDLWMTVEERPHPLPGIGVPAFERNIVVKDAPADRDVWLCLHHGVASAADIALYDHDNNRTIPAVDERGLIQIPAGPRHWLRVGDEDGDWLVAASAAPDGATWTVAPAEYRSADKTGEIRGGQLWMRIPANRNVSPIILSVSFVHGDRQPGTSGLELRSLRDRRAAETSE